MVGSRTLRPILPLDMTRFVLLRVITRKNQEINLVVKSVAAMLGMRKG